MLLRDPETVKVSGVEVKSSRDEFDRFIPSQFAADRYINRFGARATGKKARDIQMKQLKSITKVLWEPPTRPPEP